MPVSAARPQESEWITAFTDAYERVTGGQYPSEAYAVPPELRGPALWGPLDPVVEADLRAWWHWVETRPMPAGQCPIVPSLESALGYEQAVAYSRRIYPLAPPDEGHWRPGWVPLTGDQGGAIVVDTSHPDLPVYRWKLVGWLEEPPLGHGIRYLADFYTAIFDAGCLQFHQHPVIGRFNLTDAPLPSGVDQSHPIVGDAAWWARQP